MPCTAVCAVCALVVLCRACCSVCVLCCACVWVSVSMLVRLCVWGGCGCSPRYALCALWMCTLGELASAGRVSWARLLCVCVTRVRAECCVLSLAVGRPVAGASAASAVQRGRTAALRARHTSCHTATQQQAPAPGPWRLQQRAPWRCLHLPFIYLPFTFTGRAFSHSRHCTLL
jgi:hypothetical protein